MQCYTQVGDIITKIKVKIDFTLPEFFMTKIVTWECYVDYSAKVRYNMILGRYLLRELGFNLNFSKHAIEGGDRPLKGSTPPMVDLGPYKFKDLIAGKITPGESFINAYVEEVF